MRGEEAKPRRIRKNYDKSEKIAPNIKTTKFTVKQQQAWQDESEVMKGEYWTGNGTPGSGGAFIGDISYRLLVLSAALCRPFLSNGIFNSNRRSRWQVLQPHPRGLQQRFSCCQGVG